MSNTTKFDKVSFPGGYIFDDIALGVAIAATAHLRTPDLSNIEQILVRRCFDELRVRHPERFPFQNLDDLYQLRAEELFEERLSLLNSHFRASWFCLSYWSYGLFAVRSGISKAEFDDPDMFVTPVQKTLGELGIRVSEEECLAEIDRFIPAEITERNVSTGAYLFLSFVRFLHNGALRRREVVTPRLILVSAYLEFVEADAHEAKNISSFLATHGISVARQPAELTPASRLVVLCSREAMSSDIFWRGLAEWKAREVVPMVVCLMPKAEFYREPPADWRREIWTWLSENVAVQLGSKNDRYVMLLRALDPTDEKKWWWNYADAVELGLSVDLLGLGLPRPATCSGESRPTGEAYPFSFDERLIGACFLASKRLMRDPTSEPDREYLDTCNGLLELRRKANGEPYTLPWFILMYRAWLAFAARAPESAYSEPDPGRAEKELQYALFALGIGAGNSEVPSFLDTFVKLPWAVPVSSLTGIDERTIVFTTLVFHITQAALARNQRMRLQHLRCPAFVSYAREDEAFARDLVRELQAKGADVWWDLDAITLGAPLDESLRSAVGGARYLLLIATAAAGTSDYVCLEIEAAIRHGLRIVPILAEGCMPEEFLPLVASAPAAFDPIVAATESERTGAAGSVLARLERTPSEQVEWIQSQTLYRSLRDLLGRARASHA